MLIFRASIFAIELDKNGWGRTANAIFPATFIICLVAPVVFLANLVILYRWRCPRCRSVLLTPSSTETAYPYPNSRRIRQVSYAISCAKLYFPSSLTSIFESGNPANRYATVGVCCSPTL